jgi:hypothetical protein
MDACISSVLDQILHHHTSYSDVTLVFIEIILCHLSFFLRGTVTSTTWPNHNEISCISKNFNFVYKRRKDI